MECSYTIVSTASSRFWSVVLMTLVFLSSCAEYDGYNVPKGPLPAMGPAVIEASPWAVVVGSGTTHPVFVRVMDRDRNPIFNQTVYAQVEDPSVAIVDESAVTDEKGLARFIVTGVGMPDYSEITFTADSIFTKIYVWKRGYGPFWHGRY